MRDSDIPDAAVEAAARAACVDDFDKRGPVDQEMLRTHAIRILAAALPHFASEQICEGCGNTWSSDELAAQKKANPRLLSCCPERRMLGLAEMHALLAGRDAEIARLRAVLAEVLAEWKSDTQWTGEEPDIIVNARAALDPPA